MTITALPEAPSTSDPTNFAAKADALLAALATFVTEANALAVAMNLNSTTDTSATSNSIATGAKTFTVTAGKSFQPGMFLVIADTAAPSTNWMYGQVTSYSGTSLVMSITVIGGSGTKTAWTISQSAAYNIAGSLTQEFSRKAPSFSAHKSANQTLITSGIATLVTWQTELFDTNGNFASNAFTPTVAGKYQLSASVAWVSSLGGAVASIRIYKNGVLLHIKQNTSSAANLSSNVSAVVDANGSSDYFEIYAQQGSGTDQSISGSKEYTFFTGSLVG